MRMPVLRRRFAAVTATWLVLVVSEPPGVQLCAAHSQAHRGAFAAVEGSASGSARAHSTASHSAVAHGAAHSRGQIERAPELPEHPAQCTCLGGFSHAGVFHLSKPCEIAIPLAVIVEPIDVGGETRVVLPTAPSFLLPFSIGPPVLLAS